MGGVAAIMAYGTEAQKKLAASLVLGGDKPAICITEPGAGSAATGMTTTARRVRGGYVLNGTKHWITGGGVSKLHLIFARIIDGGEDRGIGAFLAVRGDIPESAGGLIIGRREPTMGLRGIPETEIILEDMFVTDAMALIPPITASVSAPLRSRWGSPRAPTRRPLPMSSSASSSAGLSPSSRACNGCWRICRSGLPPLRRWSGRPPPARLKAVSRICVRRRRPRFWPPRRR
jgi:hypothetical protein